MSADQSARPGPDLSHRGILEADLADGAMFLGHVADEAVLLVRRGAEVFAVAATCTHYGGPLADGIMDGAQLHCPWHHACFDVRTGEATRPPALSALTTYAIERHDGRIFVGGRAAPAVLSTAPPAAPESVVIVGAGAAGNAAAETLRREGYEGEITVVSAENSIPYDRPNLSKDFLAGTAPEEWISLRSEEFYVDQQINLILDRRVTGIDTVRHRCALDGGQELPYGALLLATGAVPVHLDVPGNDLPHVYYLRTVAESRAIVGRAGQAASAIIVGASFIGLEVAAALRARGIDAHVVAPDPVPMARILGTELGAFIHRTHQEHGVQFHLERTVVSIDPSGVTLSDGQHIEAELIVIGIGVRPALELADLSGLMLDRGVVVDEYLATSAPGVWAAGDIARWPDTYSGESIRVEHWAVAERQGQTAARNMLGHQERFDAVPFFWTQHYDVPINYVGHAERWDRVDIAGSIVDRDCLVAFREGERTLAVASIFRDVDSLQAELAMERRDERTLHKLIPPSE